MFKIQFTKYIEDPILKRSHIGEVRYFFSIPLGQEGRVHNLAMIAHYDKPDHGLLKESHNTY